MKIVLDAKQAKCVDEYTIHHVGIPSLVLMERAALCVVSKIKEKHNKNTNLLSICGSGGNGGDGIAAARILFEEGYAASILFLGKEENANQETRKQLEIARNLGIPFLNEEELDLCQYQVVIDAIFGIGLNRAVSGDTALLIQKINAYKSENRNFMVYSVDISSGISANCGQLLGTAVMADETITFGYIKIGHLLYPGTIYSGNVSVCDIGFSKNVPDLVRVNTFFYERDDIKRLPIRKKDGNKGTFGKVCVIAGRRNMSGAAFFSAKAAYKMGAGLVMVASDEENRVILQTLLPEILFTPLYFRDIVVQLNILSERVEKWCDGIVIGPGIATDAAAKELLFQSLAIAKQSDKFAVIDADALHILGEVMKEATISSVSDRVQYLAKILPKRSVLTPHLKELSYLLDITVNELKQNMMEIAHQLSESHLVFVLKDARTIVVGEKKVYINTSGNDGMATGGSGDVLTGILGALLAQGMPIYDAACLGVYLHGLSGDAAKDEIGNYALMASDLIDYLSKVLY